MFVAHARPAPTVLQTLLTGMPWQTLYRRYRHRPERLPRVSVSVGENGSVGDVPRAGV
jgi:hypothetical protein